MLALPAILVQQAVLGTPISYLIRADFTDTRAAGSVNGTAATPGPGTRVVVDTDGDGVSVGSGALNFANPNTGFGDPGFWLTDNDGNGIARANGRVLLHKLTVAHATNRLDWGWDSTIGDELSSYVRVWVSGANLYFRAGVNVIVDSYSASDELATALVARAAGIYLFAKGTAYSTWTLLYICGEGSTSPMFPAVLTYSADDWDIDFIRVPAALWNPPLLAYDTFTRSNSDSLGSTETAGPESQVVPARTWVAIGGDLDIVGNAIQGGDAQSEIVDNPGMETWNGANDVANWAGIRITENDETVDVNGGSHALDLQVDGGESNGYVMQNVAVETGKLYRCVGHAKNVDATNLSIYVYDVEGAASYYLAQTVTPPAWTEYDILFAAPDATLRMVLQATGGGGNVLFDDISLFEMHADYIDVSEADVQLVANVTTPASGAHPFGLILRRDGATQWLVEITPGTAGTDLQLIELNNGDPTSRATADIDWTADTSYEIQVSCNGTTINVWVDGSLELTYSSASVGQANTQFGWFDSVDGNSSLLDIQIMHKDGVYERLSRYAS